MRTVRSWNSLWSCVAIALLSAAVGCTSSGGGTSLIAIAAITPVPTPTPAIDAGQSLPVLVSVVNDANHTGATLGLTGVGTLGATTTTPEGDSDKINFNYTAPSSVSASTTVFVTAQANNTPAQKIQLPITINPALAITTTSVPNGTVATPYPTTTLTATGGTGTLKWSLVSGTLPPGFASLSPAGVLSGTPTTAGSYPITIGVTDIASLPNTVTATYTIVIAAQPPTIMPATLPNAIAGTAYSQQLAYTGGSGTAAWNIATGALPAGLTLSTSGLISGTPTNASAGATYNFTITVTAGTQTSSAVAFSIVVPALPVVTTTTIPSGNVGIAYSQQLTYTGGAGGAVSWAVVAGSLPTNSGLALSTSGLLSGTPAAATTYNFSVAVTVGSQTSVAQAYTLVINSLIITSGSSATGEVGLPFSFYLTGAGGTAPYTWSVLASGTALPTGLSLNASTGMISGSPTTAATVSGVVLQATDSASATATQTMTFTISATRTAANNVELSGQYAFLLSGFDANGKPLVTAGKFVADGNGNITGGVMDVNGTGLSAPANNTALTATTYSVGPDNRGKLTLTTAAGTSIYVLSLNTIASGVASAGYLTEFDSTGQSRTGVLALQTPSAFTTASIVSGFAFGLNGFAVNSSATALTHRATVGELQFNGTGGISSGEYVSSGTTTSPTAPVVPNSAVISIGSNGRGTLSLIVPNGGSMATVNFAVYVVSATKFYLVSVDPASGTLATNDLLFGQALQQTTGNGNFNSASLNATSVVRLEKLDMAPTGAYVTDAQIGLFTVPSSGKIDLTSDENAGGTVTSNTLSGTYTVAPNGRVAVTLASGIGGCADCITLQTYFYLVGANQGFAMDFSALAASGYFEPQTATGFAATSFNGSYALGSIEPLAQNAAYSAGVLTSTGTGSLSGKIDQDSNGTLAPDTAFTGIYTVGTSGRVAVTQAGSTPVLYIVSATKALLLNLSSANPVIEEVVHQ